MKKYKIWFCSLILAIGFIVGFEIEKYLGMAIILCSALLMLIFGLKSSDKEENK